MNSTSDAKDEVHQESESLFMYKVLTLIIVFAISLTFALIPLKLSYFKSNLKIIGIANAFSAGIFLSVALVHLLPESTEKFNEITGSNFPFSFFITILGYSLILFIEKILFVQEGDLDDPEHKNEEGSEGDLVLNMSVKSDSQQISYYLHSFKENEADKNEENFKYFFSKTGRISKMLTTGKRSEDTLLDHPFENGNSIPGSPKNNSKEVSNHQYSNDSNFVNKSHHSITSYILVIAFSIHAIFEGVALGLQNKGVSLLYLFLAISCHKWVEALTIGINFNHSTIEYNDILKFILIFSSTTPLGILFGMIFSGKSIFLEGFFFAVSSGTFIYISASEVVIEEFSVSKYKKDKFLGFLIGAIFIFVLTLFENSNEKE